MPVESRDRLLAAAVEFIARTGVGDLSLRRLAAGIGTSHRMLIYHFGSKEGLLVEVVRAVEERQRAALADLHLDHGGSIAETIRAIWRRLADPALWPHERLFFELYGQALQKRPGTTGLLDGIVDDWLDLNVTLAERLGVPADTARQHARLGLAVIRGLLLDLLATGDRAGTDAAVEAFIATYETGTHAPTDTPAPVRPSGRGHGGEEAGPADG
ncbi:TetR/AcrR family transcriptional regulator [Rhizomonospora bruguierae]|uniref:TetR/AcrR family transcriptional regulator n=1 Tax=Rhizomonospora bruguierae TaxID=1581705 RepID=UPI001BCB13AE|nr:TetR/AcrR family transcriptional regulator [Micromonospora sp. NBRC 107566]